MNIENFYDAQSKITHLLHQQTNELEQIKHSKESLILRWQQFISVILPVQIQVIQEFGYVGDQSGLSQYNEQLMELSETNPKLRKQNGEKWRFLLEHAFGVADYNEISLQEARKLIEEIKEAMTSKEFLQKIDHIFCKMDGTISMVEKRKKLLEILLPLHMSIMEKHGFSGETGYIQAQRALMDYYYDSVITEKAKDAQKVVFGRAGLL